MIRSAIRRLGESLFALLIALDILACTLWLAPLYVVNLSDRPTGRRMISSYVGYAAANGHRWAEIMATAIDWAAMRLGDKPAHCDRAYRHYRGLDA